MLVISRSAPTLKAAWGALALVALVVCWRAGLVPTTLEAGLFAINVLVVFKYGVDKLAAKAGTRRVPEALLLVLGCLGGWPAAYIAQRMFHHKTRKPSFQIGCAASVLANAVLWFLYAEYLHPNSG